MELLRIGICDDEQSWHDEAKTIIEEYAKKSNFPVELEFFYGREELLRYNGLPLHAVMMDVELEADNGIRVAAVLNEKWPECAICFVTNYLFYTSDSYEAEHVYFVLKEQFAKRIGNIFHKIIHMQEQVQKTLFFEVIGGNGKNISLSPKDILYFERKKRRTQIHTIWGTYEVWDKISDIEKQLSEPDFVRCHNSYIVYLPAIRELQKDEIIMEDGTKIVISRSYRKEVKQAFSRWALTQMI